MSSSKSGRCAFCNENFSNTSIPIPVVFGAPSKEDRGTFTKLKSLRWRFLSKKSVRTKFMCAACAEKRQVPQQAESPVSSWPHDVRTPDRVRVQKLHQWEERDYKQQRPSGRALTLEHLETHDKVRQQRPSQNMPQNARVQRVKLREQQPERREQQFECCDGQNDMRERPTNDSQRSTQTSESQQEVAHRCSLEQPYVNHHVSRESVMRNHPSSTIEDENRSKHRASVETSTRPRKSSSGQSEPCGSERKGQRLSSTADILGMSRALELPLNYFEMSSSLPKFSAMRAREQDTLDYRQMEPSGAPEEARRNRRRVITTVPQVEPRKQDETEEERERRRSASYARMLLRMRRHYDSVQMNGSQAHPATAPPRRICTKQRAKSAVVRGVKDNTANVIIDLNYLRAYKDAQ